MTMIFFVLHHVQSHALIKSETNIPTDASAGGFAGLPPAFVHADGAMGHAGSVSWTSAEPRSAL